MLGGGSNKLSIPNIDFGRLNICSKDNTIFNKLGNFH